MNTMKHLLDSTQFNVSTVDQIFIIFISNKQQSLIMVGDNFCFRIAHYKLDQTENQISWDKL